MFLSCVEADVATAFSDLYFPFCVFVWVSVRVYVAKGGVWACSPVPLLLALLSHPYFPQVREWSLRPGFAVGFRLVQLLSGSVRFFRISCWVRFFRLLFGSSKTMVIVFVYFWHAGWLGLFLDLLTNLSSASFKITNFVLSIFVILLYWSNTVSFISFLILPLITFNNF